MRPLAASVPIPKFASLYGTLVCELRNRRTLATYDLVWLWFRSPHFGLAAKMMRTSEPHTSAPHHSAGRARRHFFVRPFFVGHGARRFTPSADVAATLSPLIKSRDNPAIEERFIGRSLMRGRQRWLGVAVALLAAALMSSGAQAQAALTGLVSSSEEGAMEGVLVSAKKEGSTITTTVVTDEQGRYSFPAARME